MTERITKLLQATLDGKMYVRPTPTKFDRMDLLLDRDDMDVKRLCEYILNQQPQINEHQSMTGAFSLDDSIVATATTRYGHREWTKLRAEFYLKNIDNLSTLDWQHSVADFRNLLKKGLSGIIGDIEHSLITHTDKAQIKFLNALKQVALSLIGWAEKCSKTVREFASTVKNEQNKQRLEMLAENLLVVPKNPPKNFYQAVLSLYICFSAVPDSIGTLDRYLYDFYRNDIESGLLTREQAGEYLQELFLMIQAKTRIDEVMFTRGGESHFCIGGYLPNGDDGYNDLSKLILEKLIELPTYIPQITFRWTKKTPRETLRFVMDLERKDKNKRIAFTNDEKRIKSFTEICKFKMEDAVAYTMTGCNEPVFLGGICGSNSEINICRATERLFHEQSHKILNAETFEQFYSAFIEETYADLDIAYDYDDKFNAFRARDVNYISSLFFPSCIENAKSLTQGGCNTVISTPMLIGIVNVIDALIVVKQFVYEQKVCTMKQLVDALKANWVGFEWLRLVILKKAEFFGNDTLLSNEVAQKFYLSLYTYLNGKKNLFGYPLLVGDLVGYHEHHKWFGENTKATPDGRFSGDTLKFGLVQSQDKSKEGLTAFLNSVACVDPKAIACGSTVTNVSIDEQLIKNDNNFEKLVDVFETYFKNGGVHFQLTYVSKEELIKAKQDPEKYKNLRVRVSGFSDYFVNLKESLQDSIIARAEHKN